MNYAISILAALVLAWISWFNNLSDTPHQGPSTSYTRCAP